jgi:lipopolysaccharide transport system ATP-binding protein
MEKMNVVLKAENISKQYRLGQVGTGTLSHDLKRWLYKIRGKNDPFLRIGDENDRTKTSQSEYVWALKDLDFEVYKGDVLGIIGKNGAGKSTLLKLLSQVTAPTTGTIKIKGRIAALLEVGTGFHPDLTGLENIFLNGAILGMKKSEIKSKLDEIVDFSGCLKYIDTPVKRYSSGMIVRLGFAVAAHLEPEILIVDEVLAVGDSEFQDKCIAKMKDISGQGRTVIFVSHNMASMKSLCKKGMLMSNGRMIQQGSIDSIIETYLAATHKATYSGDIPANASSINRGIVKFKKILMLDENNNKVDVATYLSPLHFYFELDAKEYLLDTLLDVRISTVDGMELVHAMNKYNSFSKSTFNVGHNTVHCKMQNHLQPGKYSVTIGIHQLNGTTLEYVENILDFTVLNIAAGDKGGFTYDFKLGHVRFESEWTIN